MTVAPSRTVHIVEDDDAVRWSVAFLLKGAGYAVVEHASGTAFLAALDTLSRGLVLLDIRMREVDGLAVQAELQRRGMALPIIITTGHGDVSKAVRAMKAGALDFLEKPYSDQRLLDAARDAFAAVEPAPQPGMITDRLSKRERDVLAGLAAGHQNKTIAIDLDISTRTVEMHRARLMAKLGTRTLSATLAIALREQFAAQS